MNNKISNGNVVFELLKDTYDGNSEKAIFNKMCKLIPKETIKVKDISRGNFLFIVKVNGLIKLKQQKDLKN